MLDEEPTPGGLVKFHTAHKLTREAVRGLLRAMAHGHWACPVARGYTEMAQRSAGAGWSPTRVSEIGRNWQPTTAPSSWKALA